MAEYRFDIDDDLWTEWREAIPDGATPDERVAALLRADLDGRVDTREGPRGIPEMNTETQTAPIDPSAVDGDDEG